MLGEPHPNPPKVPRPAAGSAAERARRMRAAEFRFQVRAGEPIRKLAEDYVFRHPTDFSAEFKHWYAFAQPPT